MGGVLSGRQPELGTSLDKDLPPWLDWLMLALDRSWPFYNPRHVRVPEDKPQGSFTGAQQQVPCMDRWTERWMERRPGRERGPKVT